MKINSSFCLSSWQQALPNYWKSFPDEKIAFVYLAPQDNMYPKEEGLDQVILKRVLSVFEIKLCKTVTKDEESAPGYMAPLPESEV